MSKTPLTNTSKDSNDNSLNPSIKTDSMKENSACSVEDSKKNSKPCFQNYLKNVNSKNIKKGGKEFQDFDLEARVTGPASERLRQMAARYQNSSEDSKYYPQNFSTPSYYNPEYLPSYSNDVQTPPVKPSIDPSYLPQSYAASNSYIEETNACVLEAPMLQSYPVFPSSQPFYSTQHCINRYNDKSHFQVPTASSSDMQNQWSKFPFYDSNIPFVYPNTPSLDSFQDSINISHYIHKNRLSTDFADIHFSKHFNVSEQFSEKQNSNSEILSSTETDMHQIDFFEYPQSFGAQNTIQQQYAVFPKMEVVTERNMFQDSNNSNQQSKLEINLDQCQKDTAPNQPQHHTPKKHPPPPYLSPKSKKRACAVVNPSIITAAKCTQDHSKRHFKNANEKHFTTRLDKEIT